MHVATVRECAADKDDAASQRIVTRDVDVHVADDRHRVGGNGEEAPRGPDEVDPVERAGIGHRDVRDGGGECGSVADTERGTPDDGVGVHGHVGGARDHDARDGGMGERAARGQRWPRDDEAAHASRRGLEDGPGQGEIAIGRPRAGERDVEPDGRGAGAGDAAEHARQVVAGQRLAAVERVEGRVVDGDDDETRRLARALQINEEVEGAGLQRLQVAHGRGAGDRTCGHESHRPQLQQPGAPLLPPIADAHQSFSLSEA